MVRLCSDRDILKYEPALFGELHFKNQVIAAGTDGAVAGTTFESDSADFVSAQVEAGDCIYIKSADGTIEGVYEIVSVDSATQLSVSVLRADSQGDPIVPPAGSGFTYRISTFKPQISDVSMMVMEYLGLELKGDSAKVTLNTDEIHMICAMGTISSAYRSLADGDNAENFRAKSQEYQCLFSKGLEMFIFAIDEDGDGVADKVRYGGTGKLFRE